MPPRQAEQIWRWHERAYRGLRGTGGEAQTFEHLGRTLVAPPGVMPITPVSPWR